MWEKITPEQKQILKNAKKGDMISLNGIVLLKVIKDKRKELCDNCIFDNELWWSCGTICGVNSNRKYLIKFIKEVGYETHKKTKKKYKEKKR